MKKKVLLSSLAMLSAVALVACTPAISGSGATSATSIGDSSSAADASSSPASSSAPASSETSAPVSSSSVPAAESSSSSSLDSSSSAEPEPIEEPEIQVATVADLAAVSFDANQKYSVTAYITDIASTVYGNISIADAPDDTAVSLYGLSASASSISWDSVAGTYSFANDKSFATIEDGALKIGDQIEVVLIAYTSGTYEDISGYFVRLVPPTEVRIAVTPASTSVAVGNTVDLVATVDLPEDITDDSVSWTSSDESIATVAGGTVTGVASGTANITATSNADPTKSAVATVSVIAPALGATYTYDFTTNTAKQSLTDNSLLALLQSSVSGDSDIVTAVSGTDSAYATAGDSNDSNTQNGRIGVKLSTSNNNGTFTLTTALPVSRVSITASSWRAASGSGASSTVQVTVGGVLQVFNADDQTVEFVLTEPSTEITLSAAGRIIISSLSLIVD